MIDTAELFEVPVLNISGGKAVFPNPNNSDLRRARLRRKDNG